MTRVRVFPRRSESQSGLSFLQALPTAALAQINIDTACAPAWTPPSIGGTSAYLLTSRTYAANAPPFELWTGMRNVGRV